jgi:2-polyprenyl-3-methyl-5-hydroxy-6-metoxy-1,4-benzoquinol methylase
MKTVMADYNPKLRVMLDTFRVRGGPYAKRVLSLAQDLDFVPRAELLVEWAYSVLGEATFDVLVDGYKTFVCDVNQSQYEYETRGSYANTSFVQVYDRVYGNPEYMQKYHWGVYLTTVAWEHHLRLVTYFERAFVDMLGHRGALLDLASGSGVWSLMFLHQRPGWTSAGVDISPTSVASAKLLARNNGFSERADFKQGDVTSYCSDPVDAIVSCFVLEHLQNPSSLFRTMYANLKPKGYAFVTVALTAAEIDHISEFRRESEVICMAENAGLRLVGCLSSSPARHPDNRRFLPRSLGMTLQRRRNDIW